MDWRTAETPAASTVHHPFGSPSGPGLFHVKGLQLPAYIQNVAHAFRRKGLSESQAIQRAIGVVKDWAAGRAPGGGHVHPDVKAAAAKAVAEWEAAKAAAHGRNASMAPEYRAQLTAQSINDLPDSDFAYIEPGGSKDSSGKTTPRSLRHFPIQDAAHVRNALSRAPQSPFGDKAMPKIRAAAKKFGIDAGGDSNGRSAGWSDAERRYTPGLVEARTTPDGKRIGGYAIVFETLSRTLGGFVERSLPHVVNQARSLGWPNVVCRYNHDSNMVLGTTAGGTLGLQADNTGLDYDVLPPNARADILELVERRDIQFSSFAFRVPAGGDEWGVTDQNYPMRTLHEIQLIDVAPVLDPAYPDATAGLRSLAAAMDAPFEDVAG
ncbi:MAG TPA: HK97 family phage prohead protease, partial [Streptosporangiaceae bacterium]